METKDKVESGDRILLNVHTLHSEIKRIHRVPDGIPVRLSKSKYTPGSSEKLTKKTGYYIVADRGLFYYYKITSPVMVNEHLYRFVPTTETRKEGFVVINKELVYVTFDDLNRKVIRLSRTVKTKRTNITYDDLINNTYGPPAKPEQANPAPLSDTHTIDLTVGKKTSDYFGASTNIGVEELQAANLALAEQERALFNSFSEEEGFDYEIEEAA